MSCAVAIDTLKTDSAMLNALRNNPDFGYSRELVQVKSSTWQWMSDRLAEWYQSLLNSVFPNENNWYLWLIVALVVIGIIIAIVVVRNRYLLRLKENTDSGYVVTDDTIYGIDFEQQIKSALGRDDYRTALRMMYLQTLKWLTITTTFIGNRRKHLRNMCANIGVRLSIRLPLCLYAYAMVALRPTER